MQTGAGQLYAGSVQSFLQDGRRVRARCNHTIEYDPTLGFQPTLVQHVRARSVEASFDPASEELRFQLGTSLHAGTSTAEFDPVPFQCEGNGASFPLSFSDLPGGLWGTRGVSETEAGLHGSGVTLLG